MKNTALDLTADTIDIRELIERFEELEGERESLVYDYSEAHEDPNQDHKQAEQALALWDEENGEEFKTLTAILEELKDCGGDEQWRGDWYPLTLIEEGYFTQYAEELVSECYDLSKIPHFVHIDWELTAREVLHDYSAVDVDGRTYFYR